jgi:hypothetical protein
MKRKQTTIEQLAESGPASIRTREIVLVAGTWLSECSRDGCRAAVEMNLELHQGAPAPPCPRCLNPTTLRFLRAIARVEPPAEAQLLPDVAPAASAQVSATVPIRTGEIVPTSGTWLIRCDVCGDEQKVQHKGAWADPCSRCRKPALLFFLQAIQVSWGPVEAPVPFAPGGGLEQLKEIARSKGSNVILLSEIAPPVSTEQKQIDSPPVAEREPTLFEKLSGKSGSGKKAKRGI